MSYGVTYSLKGDDVTDMSMDIDVLIDLKELCESTRSKIGQKFPQNKYNDEATIKVESSSMSTSCEKK